MVVLGILSVTMIFVGLLTILIVKWEEYDRGR